MEWRHLAQVLSVDRHRCGLPVVLTDLPLDEAPVIWSGAHLVNRESRARQKRCLLVRRVSRVDITETTDVVLAYLPSDIRMGDLLAFPSRVPAGVPSRRRSVS